MDKGCTLALLALALLGLGAWERDRSENVSVGGGGGGGGGLGGVPICVLCLYRESYLPYLCHICVTRDMM